MKIKNLHTKFAEYGSIKGLIIAINDDHTSKGNGFIIYENASDANRAID